jgi:hypothetical protein
LLACNIQLASKYPFNQFKKVGIMSTDVFISYATQDQKLADSVCKSLEKAGIMCWIAPRDILPGVEYADGIIDGLNHSRIFLVILSQASNSSPQVAREVERAVSKNLHILTFRTDNTVLSRAMEYYLSNHHWIDASDSVLSKQLFDLTSTVKQLLKRYPQKKVEEKDFVADVEKVAEKVQKVDLPVVISPVTRPESQSIYSATKDKVSIRRQMPGWVFICGGLLLVLVFAGYMLLSGKIPFGQIPPTIPAQSTQVSLNDPGREATVEAVREQQIWVEGFINPILVGIRNRPPDFAEYFNDPSLSQWDELDPNMFFVVDGKLRSRLNNVVCYGIFPHVQAKDVVIKYEFTPVSLNADDGGVVVDAHGFTFNLDFSNNPESWWGITHLDSSGNWVGYKDIAGFQEVSKVGVTTRVD